MVLDAASTAAAQYIKCLRKLLDQAVTDTTFILKKCDVLSKLSEIRNGPLRERLKTAAQALHRQLEERYDFDNVMQSVATAYLTDNALQSIACKLDAAIDKDGNVKEDLYDEAVEDSYARITLCAAMRAGNLSNMRMSSVKSAKVIKKNGKSFVVIPVQDHKVKKTRQLKVVCTDAEYNRIILPLVKAAKKRAGTDNVLKERLFVTARGNPVRKSSFIFGKVNRGRAKKSKISANVVRHASVSLIANQKREGISSKEHAMLLLHSENMASNTYRVVRDEDIVNLVEKYRVAMYAI